MNKHKGSASPCSHSARVWEHAGCAQGTGDGGGRGHWRRHATTGGGWASQPGSRKGTGVTGRVTATAVGSRTGRTICIRRDWPLAFESLGPAGGQLVGHGSPSPSRLSTDKRHGDECAKRPRIAEVSGERHAERAGGRRGSRPTHGTSRRPICVAPMIAETPGWPSVNQGYLHRVDRGTCRSAGISGTTGRHTASSPLSRNRARKWERHCEFTRTVDGFHHYFPLEVRHEWAPGSLDNGMVHLPRATALSSAWVDWR